MTTYHFFRLPLWAVLVQTFLNVLNVLSVLLILIKLLSVTTASRLIWDTDDITLGIWITLGLSSAVSWLRTIIPASAVASEHGGSEDAEEPWLDDDTAGV